MKKQKILRKISLIALSSLVMVSTAGAALNEELFYRDSTVLSENDFDFALSEALTVSTDGNKKLRQNSKKSSDASLFIRLLAVVGGLYGLNKGHEGLRQIFGDALFTIGVQYGMAFERVEGNCADHSKPTDQWEQDAYDKMIEDSVPIWIHGDYTSLLEERNDNNKLSELKMNAGEQYNHEQEEKVKNSRGTGFFKNHPGTLSELDLRLQILTGWSTGCLFYDGQTKNGEYERPNLTANAEIKEPDTAGFKQPKYSFQYLQAVPYYLKYAYNADPTSFGRVQKWAKEVKTIKKNFLSSYKTYEEAINAYYQGFQLSYFNKSLGALYLKEMIKFGKYLSYNT